ncbi:unnamed protein product, partial [Nesidiocoris tenuis]
DLLQGRQIRCFKLGRYSEHLDQSQQCTPSPSNRIVCDRLQSKAKENKFAVRVLVRGECERRAEREQPVTASGRPSHPTGRHSQHGSSPAVIPVSEQLGARRPLTGGTRGWRLRGRSLKNRI